MFRDACSVAPKFTFPVIVSMRTIGGKCTAGMGPYIVVNDEGWIVTAGHVLKQLADLAQSAQRCQTHSAKEAAIRANKALHYKEQSKQ
jgi:hypothetical protein